MKEKQLMKLILDDPALIRDKLLTFSQVKIFNIIKGRGCIGISSYSLSDILNISIQSASIRLAKLYQKKYLNRFEVDSESGGIEYVYKTAI